MAGAEERVAGATAPVETEAKLHASRRAFAALTAVDSVAGWRVAARRDVSLRDTYWDTPDGRLARAGCTLRVRELRHQDGTSDRRADAGARSAATAELTLKGPQSSATGGGLATWSRTEQTVAAPPGSGPREWARQPAARPLLDAVERLAASEDLRPDVVLLNPRHEIVLEGRGGQIVLSLDEVAIEGAPYRRRYVEAELTRGTPASLDGLVAALVQRYPLRPSRRGKVQAARDWLARRRRSAIGCLTGGTGNRGGPRTGLPGPAV